MTYTRVTTATGEGRECKQVALSADGTVVAFSSDNDFLAEGIPDDQYEIWLYEVGTKTYTRVTTASDSQRDSFKPSLNADGSIVAFESDSDFLGQGLIRDHQEIWLYNTATMTFTRVSNSQEGGRDGYNPSLSGDGTIVAFTHDSDFLNQGIADNQFEIWLYDTGTMTVTRVTYGSDSGRASDQPSLSADGTVLAFQSDSDFLNTGIPDNQFEVWLFDTGTMTYTRISVGSDANRDSFHPSLSADGSALAFHSDSDFHLEGIPDNQNEIWFTRLKYFIYLPMLLK
jgi:Tol biopolymer transport system component